MAPVSSLSTFQKLDSLLFLPLWYLEWSPLKHQWDRGEVEYCFIYGGWWFNGSFGLGFLWLVFIWAGAVCLAFSGCCWFGVLFVGGSLCWLVLTLFSKLVDRQVPAQGGSRSWDITSWWHQLSPWLVHTQPPTWLRHPACPGSKPWFD